MKFGLNGAWNCVAPGIVDASCDDFAESFERPQGFGDERVPLTLVLPTRGPLRHEPAGEPPRRCADAERSFVAGVKKEATRGENLVTRDEARTNQFENVAIF